MSSLPFGSWLLGSGCSAQYPYLSLDRDTWVDCKSRQGYIIAAYVTLFCLIALMVMYWYVKDSPANNFSRWCMAAIVFNVVLFLFLPYYKERVADMEYSQYENEFAKFKSGNPAGTLSDYLGLKFGEEQARASSSIAGAQNIMAGAFLLDALSGLRR